MVTSTILSERFHVLPREGGLLDQDAGWVTGMQMVLEALHEKAEYEEKKRKKN